MITADHRAETTRPADFFQTCLDMNEFFNACIHDQVMNSSFVSSYGCFINDILNEYRRHLKEDVCPLLPHL